MLLIIGYRGWRRDGMMTDFAAIYIEPILDAWGIKQYLVDGDVRWDRFRQHDMKLTKPPAR